MLVQFIMEDNLHSSFYQAFFPRLTSHPEIEPRTKICIKYGDRRTTCIRYSERQEQEMHHIETHHKYHTHKDSFVTAKGYKDNTCIPQHISYRDRRTSVKHSNPLRDNDTSSRYLHSNTTRQRSICGCPLHQSALCLSGTTGVDRGSWRTTSSRPCCFS